MFRIVLIKSYGCGFHYVLIGIGSLQLLFATVLIRLTPENSEHEKSDELYCSANVLLSTRLKYTKSVMTDLKASANTS